MELVCESLRLAVRAVSEVAPAWVAQTLPPTFLERYDMRQSEYGLSQSQVQSRLVQAGEDGFWFLAQLERSAPEAVQSLAEVATLRTVLAQQFPSAPGGGPAAKRPSGEGVIESPHEPDARYASKRGQGWIGYRVQVTESCDDKWPHLIVDLAATSAPANDAPQLPQIQQRLRQQGTLPSEQQVDQGYMSGQHLVQSAQLGIELVGPLPQDTHVRPGFRQADFEIDEAAQQATCPQGQRSRLWCERPDPAGGPPTIQIRFAAASCQACPCFGTCTSSRQGRSLELHPYRALLLARRAEAQTEAFRQRCHRRAGIEATISELTRAHGLRRARYRRLAKQALQSYFTALAVNLKRLAHWWTQPAPAA
jgi:transposase